MGLDKHQSWVLKETCSLEDSISRGLSLSFVVLVESSSLGE